MLKTSIKSLALLAALFGTGELMAQNCNTTAWGVNLAAGQAVSGSPTAGAPTAGVSRYSGRCGLRSNAPADFVRDGSPNDEPTYITRFYVRPNVTTGTAVLFQALEDGQGTPSIQVTQTGNQLGLSARGVAAATNLTISPGFWYSVELNWAAGGAMTYAVRGAGVATNLTGSLSGVAAGAQVDQANLGWISGGSGGTVTTDAFESRRTQAIGRLCRGDANNDGGVSGPDVIQARTESLGGALALGQPDCNEDGGVSGPDVICIRNLSLGAGCAG